MTARGFKVFGFGVILGLWVICVAACYFEPSMWRTLFLITVAVSALGLVRFHASYRDYLRTGNFSDMKSSTRHDKKA